MTSRPARDVLAVAALFAVGALVAVQARTNGDLAVRLGGGLSGGAQAALVNFGVGLLVVSVWIAARPAQRQRLGGLRRVVADGTLPAWQCLAGLGGALLILSQAASVPTLGVAVFTVAVVAGQTGGSLGIDQLGLGPAGPAPVTSRRAFAAGLTLAAVALSVLGRSGPNALSPLLLLCIVGGFAVAVQSTYNGRNGRAVGSTVVATWLNFVAGGLGLLVVVLILMAAGHPMHALPGTWWLYAGGPMGVAFVSVVAAAIRVVSVLLVSLATVAGQVLGALLLDAFAPVAGQGLHLITVLGTALPVVAVLIAASEPGNRRASDR